MTLIEHELYKAISPRDCLSRIWGGQDGDDRNTVSAFIERFNTVSGWAAWLVVREDELDQRVSAIQALIATAKQCMRFRNFNGVMEIISALGSSPVRRLTSSWAAVPQPAMAEFHEMEQLMLADDNFKYYRAKLAKARPPAVPYFGIFLRDLTLIHHGNRDYIQFGLVNAVKIQLMFNQLRLLQRLQQQNYNFLIVPEMISYLRDISKPDEEEVHSRSKVIQPSVFERNRSGTRFGGLLPRRSSMHEG